MQKNNLRTLTLSLLFFTITNVNAQTKHLFSVQQCVDYGIQHSNTVKNALLDIQNQIQVNRQVTSSALPQITASASVNDFFDIPTQVAGSFGAVDTSGTSGGSGGSGSSGGAFSTNK